MNTSRGPATGPRGRRLSYALVLTPLLIGNALMLALCLLGFYTLSATRAYVGGESQWSKARAQAVKHLRAYASSGAPRSLQRFAQALEVPLGDQAARQLMEQPQLDWAACAAALGRGGNAPEDVPGMIRLYRWFGHSALLAPAIDIWRQADTHIARLQTLARQLEQAFERPDAGKRSAQLTLALAALDELDNELLGLERRFGQALGEASRAAFEILALAIGLTALLLTLSAYALARLGLGRQRRYENALEDANRRWTLAAEADGLGLFEWRQREDRVLLDARACAVYGLKADPAGLEIARSRVRRLVEPADADALQEQLDLATSAGTLFRQRFRVRPSSPGAAGPLRHVEVTGVMRGSLATGDRRMVGMIKDVTAQVRQEQLALEKAAAERSAAARTEFLSRLSHELRTPLNAVLGFSELLLMDRADGLSTAQRQRIQLIADSGRHLLHLVDDVLDISGIDAGRFRIERRPTPLLPVLESAVALVSAERQEYGVRLEQASPPPGLAVWADAQRLGQVLANLLSNACKYNRRGGLVRIEVQPGEAGVRISVADQGQGLGEDEIAQLFQPFKRLPATAHLRGTGLGLSIAKLLVEQMGGRIEVHSRPGQGTVFSVILQAAPPPAAPAWAGPAAPSPGPAAPDAGAPARAH